MQLEIKSARAATKTPNGQVAITSETENLNAIGNELIYNAETRLTVLKGSPDMVAVKDGNEIRARELRMKMDERSVTEVIAPGPGRIALLDREKGQRHLHAYWRDELTATREGTVDVLLLTGQARFEDQEQGQRIQADRLKVWLEPGPEDAKKPALKPAASDTEREAQRRRPRRLEARGHVQALSPDMRVRETESLVIHFADASLPQGPPAPSSPPPKPAAASQPTSSPASQPAVADTTKPTPEKPARPKSPLEVSAQFMEAYVLRTEAKNELDKLVCRGAVHVQQTPATPDDKEVDIRGDTLELTRRPEGNVLVVIGKVALVKLDKITMFGPVVTIDQTTNRATVVGTGAMTMPSNTTFEGGKLDKTTMLTVHWNESMFFEGRFAEFQGGVQALQDQSQVTCRTMQVELDREVSFRENAKGGETPKVHKVVCVETVRIEEKTVENGRITAHKKLSAKELALDNLDGRVHAGGPGWVRILQLGAKEEVLPTPGAARPKPVGAARPSAAKDEMELKLTRVVYQGRMLADNTNRTAFFFDNVEVVHLPAKEIDLAIDVDRLPAGAVHLQCQNTLKVYSSRDKNGKTSQVMEAYGRVQVRAQEFWGWADMVKYNEETDQLIFEAKEGNYASLHRVRVQGEDPQVIRGKKILYWRQSREYRVEGAVDVRGGN
jgi:lipopolysaccharide export system protein LptA